MLSSIIFSSKSSVLNVSVFVSSTLTRASVFEKLKKRLFISLFKKVKFSCCLAFSLVNSFN